MGNYKHYTWAILAGGSCRAPDRVTALARQARARARVERFPAPSALLAAHGLELQIVKSLPARQVVSGSRLFARRGPDAREEGWSAFLAIAHALLEQSEGAHEEADAVRLAAELAAPSSSARRMSVSDLAQVQRHVPRWVFRAWTCGLRFCERSH